MLSATLMTWEFRPRRKTIWCGWPKNTWRADRLPMLRHRGKAEA